MYMHVFVLADIFSGLGINALAFLSQLVSFGIVFLLLWRWGLPMIIRTMDRRQAVIREGIENAEKAKRDLEEATARAEAELLEARRQAQDIIAHAEKAGQPEEARLVEKANAR